MKLIEPLRKFWPDWRQRRQLVAEYQQLGRMKAVLADIAKRGSVFNAGQPHRDMWEAGIAEGRRQIALELIRTASLDPALLQSACTDPIPPEGRRHPGRPFHMEE